jgi:hypothetical protein
MARSSLSTSKSPRIFCMSRAPFRFFQNIYPFTRTRLHLHDIRNWHHLPKQKSIAYHHTCLRFFPPARFQNPQKRCPPCPSLFLYVGGRRILEENRMTYLSFACLDSATKVQDKGGHVPKKVLQNCACFQALIVKYSYS